MGYRIGPNKDTRSMHGMTNEELQKTLTDANNKKHKNKAERILRKRGVTL